MASCAGTGDPGLRAGERIPLGEAMEDELRRRDGAKGQGTSHYAHVEPAEGAHQPEAASVPSASEPIDGAAAVSHVPGSVAGFAPAAPVEQPPTLARLRSAIAWYDQQSAQNMRASRRLRTATVIAVAMIPFFAGLGVPPSIVGGLGVVAVLLELLQQLHQYERLGARYRVTAEALKHEHYLFLAGAGPYEGRGTVLRLLAERVEALVAQAEPE
jgi:hypothetical protein